MRELETLLKSVEKRLKVKTTKQKYVNMNVQLRQFPNPQAMNNPKQVIK